MSRMSNTRRGHRRLRPWLSEPANLGLSRQPRWRWLVWLLAVDLALVVIPIINRATLDSRFLRIDIEFGLGEIYQYGKFILIAVIMADLARRSRGLSPLLWALVFAYLALDDALALHESIGANFARVLGSEPGAPGIQVLADLTVTAGLGVVVLLAFKGGIPGRRSATVLVVGLLTFGIFAGGVDVLARIDPVLERRAVRGAFAVVEEGGELLVISSTMWFVLMMRREFAFRRRPLRDSA